MAQPELVETGGGAGGNIIAGVSECFASGGIGLAGLEDGRSGGKIRKAEVRIGAGFAGESFEDGRHFRRPVDRFHGAGEGHGAVVESGVVQDGRLVETAFALGPVLHASFGVVDDGAESDEAAFVGAGVAVESIEDIVSEDPETQCGIFEGRLLVVAGQQYSGALEGGERLLDGTGGFRIGGGSAGTGDFAAAGVEKDQPLAGLATSDLALEHVQGHAGHRHGGAQSGGRHEHGSANIGRKAVAAGVQDEQVALFRSLAGADDLPNDGGLSGSQFGDAGVLEGGQHRWIRSGGFAGEAEDRVAGWQELEFESEAVGHGHSVVYREGKVGEGGIVEIVDPDKQPRGAGGGCVGDGADLNGAACCRFLGRRTE